MAMVQDPATTEYDGMPRSAIATGLVDYELQPNEMVTQIIAYVSHAFGNRSPIATYKSPKIENTLNKIFILLRDHVGHDFSQYKPSTIHRRIERRMAVHQIDSIDGYIKYLQQTPTEVDSLFRDLLIGVTSFFRDPEAFKVLEEKIIPKLFAGKPTGSAVRVWSAGCSTGEEAYSIAILMQEHLEALKENFKVQIFATDIDSQAGCHSPGRALSGQYRGNLSPQRLQRFFLHPSLAALHTEFTKES